MALGGPGREHDADVEEAPRLRLAGAGSAAGAKLTGRASSRTRRAERAIGVLLLLACAIGGAVGTRALLLRGKDAGPRPSPAIETRAPGSAVAAGHVAGPGRVAPISPRPSGSSSMAAVSPGTPSPARSPAPPSAPRTTPVPPRPARLAAAPRSAPSPARTSAPAGSLATTPPAASVARREPARERSALAANRLSEPATRSYWLEVGAFTNREAARRLASLLREQEPPASADRWVVVVKRDSAGTPLARVRLGPFPDRAAAAPRLREFQAKGYGASIAEERD
jgi:cell division septation protein DedD